MRKLIKALVNFIFNENNSKKNKDKMRYLLLFNDTIREKIIVKWLNKWWNNSKSVPRHFRKRRDITNKFSNNSRMEEKWSIVKQFKI